MIFQPDAVASSELHADETYVRPPVGPVVSVDASRGKHFRFLIDQDCELRVDGGTSGAHVFVRVEQDAVGSRTLTPNAAIVFRNGETAFNLATAAGAVTVLEFVYDELAKAMECVTPLDRTRAGGLYANRTLSNLTAPTAVNVAVLPGADATITLGTIALRFDQVNLATGVFVWNANTDVVPTTALLSGRIEWGAGGSSATDVTLGRLAANVAGLGAGDEFRWQGGTSGYVGIVAPATPTNYTITLPPAVPGGNGYALISSTGGVTSWANLAALYDAAGAAATALSTAQAYADSVGKASQSYWSVLGNFVGLTTYYAAPGEATLPTNEYQFPVTRACVAQRLFARVTDAPGTGNLVVTIRKNGSDGTVVATIAGAATTASDTTHTLAFTAGDIVSVSVTTTNALSVPKNLTIGFELFG